MASSIRNWNESDRIQELHDLNVLDTPPEERFDRLTRLARRLFDVPIALVSLVDSDRQWFKSHDGIDTTETPREWSFCTHAIADGKMLVVPDALSDDRFRDSPLVTDDPAIRFYAGQPIRSPAGAPIGTLCIIDRQPRDLKAEDAVLLADIASLVERELAAIRLATIDELTGLSNRRGFKMLAGQAISMCKRHGRPATLLVFDLDGFKAINDTLGHASGDAALASFGADLLANYRNSDVVARLGGDEFCVLLSGTSADGAMGTLDKLSERLERRGEGRDPVAQFSFSIGAAEYDPERHPSISDLVAAADEQMYRDKRAGR
jgi:diguanylate cyclase (GGDEF)-like protein